MLTWIMYNLFNQIIQATRIVKVKISGVYIYSTINIRRVHCTVTVIIKRVQ